jgi:hypothetical protein
VETIELLDVDTVRIRSSIDFRIPTALPGSITLGNQETFFLPLVALQRRVNLAFFDVRDESGMALPLLTRQENARLTGSILILAAKRALAEFGLATPLSRTLLAFLARIPKLGFRQAQELVEQVLDPTNEALYPNGGNREHLVAPILLGDRDFRELLGLCSSCSLVHLPITACAGERRIVKITVVSPWSTPESSLQERKRRLAVWVGWRAEVKYLALPQVGNAESFHLQIQAPERVEFTNAGVVHIPSTNVVKEYGPKAPPYRALLGSAEPWSESDEVKKVAVEGVGKRKHIYIHGSHDHRSGLLYVCIRIVRHGFLRASVALAWLTTFLLALFAVRAKNILGEEQTAAALLLLVPVLIAGFLVAPGEHGMTRRLLRGPRFLTAVIGALALCAIALLLTIPKVPDPGSQRNVPEILVVIWIAEGVAALSVSLALTVSLVAEGGP